MYQKAKQATILIVEDDPDDRLLVADALKKAQIYATIQFIENGEELIDYLHHRDKYASPSTFPQPDLIILDLNMPRKDGREAIIEVKSNPTLKHIPIIVFTTSTAKEDIFYSYNLGANSYIIKPDNFDDLVNIMKCINLYWFQVVSLPGSEADL